MSDRSRSVREELRDIEDRVAARTARIDQLQSKVIARHSLVRLGFVQGVAVLMAALIATTFAPDTAVRMVIASVLAWTAAALVAVTAVGHAVIAWEEFRGPERLELRFRPRYAWRRGPAADLSVLGVLAAVLATVPVVTRTGSAASIFALTVCGSLVAANRLMHLWLPRYVGVAAAVVAIGAALSVGTAVGAYVAPVDWHGTAKKSPRSQQLSRLATGAVQPGPSPYVRACGSASPWAGEPGRALANLREAWAAMGGVAAGCPGPPHPVSADGSVIAAVGSCGGRLQSLGVADAQHAVLLTGAAAADTEALIQNRRLLAAPTHLLVGGGDLYVVPSTDGTIVLARRTVESASAEGSGGGGCAAATRGGGYVVLSPALTGLWVSAMKRTGTWLWPSEAKPVLNGEHRYELNSRLGEVEWQAACSQTTGNCMLQGGGEVERFTPASAKSVTSADLLRLAPQAP
jgi:hypothetical protein